MIFKVYFHHIYQRGFFMDFKDTAERYESWIIEQRRFFHAHPELSFEEFHTTREIGQRLAEMGLVPHYYPDHNGVWTVIEGENAGAGTVALRADIDALPVEEHTGLPFASQNPGVMHACGHDCHIAMLLGGVRILMEHRDQLKGRVKILFQAAEESCHGAEYYIRQGFLDDVDAIYSTHIWGELDAPYLNFGSGARLASCDNFRIEISGNASHGAAPHQGADAILTAAYLITEIQAVVSRMNDPLNPLVITVGRINGGQRFNIVADKVVMEGTARTHSPEMRNRIEPLLRKIAQNTADSMGTRASLTYEYFPAPIINEHEDLVRIASDAAVRLYGPDALKPFPKMMISEDFAYFMEKVPGVFGLVGSRNESLGLTAANHNDHYTADESVLKRGAAMYAQFAHDFLEKYSG